MRPSPPPAAPWTGTATPRCGTPTPTAGSGSGSSGGGGGRKRAREEDEETPDGPDADAKRQRTPAYENSSAVMHDRGYQQVGPQHELTGKLVDYLGGAPRLHPPMSNSLLQKVNPHQQPVNAGADFRPGSDLNACLENVEAYRDTHFGRPRVSGQTLHGTVEPIPGNTLWKRHDGPALFGQGPDAVQKLMDQVRRMAPAASPPCSAPDSRATATPSRWSTTGTARCAGPT